MYYTMRKVPPGSGQKFARNYYRKIPAKFNGQ